MNRRGVTVGPSLLILGWLVLGSVLGMPAWGAASNDCLPSSRKLDLLERLSLGLNRETASPKCRKILGAVSVARHDSSATEPLLAELHATVEPSLARQVPDGAIQPIREVLVELIDQTPKNSRIKVAIYGFNDGEIVASLRRALARGVVLHLLVNDNGAEALAKFGKALPPRLDRIASKGRIPMSRSWHHSCANKIADNGQYDEQLTGGCLSRKLLHHKFVTFSGICRFGITPEGTCVQSAQDSRNVFHDVVFQSSGNFIESSWKHNVATVFFGNTALQDFYRDHFRRMTEHALELAPVDDAESVTTLPLSGKSSLQVEFTPKSTSKTESRELDLNSHVLFRDLMDLPCTKGARGERPVVRIAHADWRNGRKPLLLADRMVEQVARLVGSGCRVRVILADEYGAGPDEVYCQLTQAGAETRSYAAVGESRSESENHPSLHAKYTVYENAVTPQQNRLLFGTVNLIPNSQSNDNVWIRWDDPDTTALRAYSDTFDRIWNSLPKTMRGGACRSR